MAECHSADYADKANCRLVGTGSCGGFHRALWGESTLQRTLKLCRERPTGIFGIKSNRGECTSERPVGLDLKIGVGRGACTSLKWVSGQARPIHFCDSCASLGPACR